MVPLQAFHHPVTTGIWVAIDALWIIPEMIVSWRRPEKDAQKADRGSKLVVVMSIYMGVFFGFMAAIEVPSLSLGSHWRPMFAFGIAVWLAGIFLRWYSIHTLGRFFTTAVAISKNHHVVERGLYRWLRHPSYLGGLVAITGLGMTLTNWLAMFLPVCCLAAAYVYRISIEEHALVRGLGDDYIEYMERTWRLIPYVF